VITAIFAPLLAAILTPLIHKLSRNRFHVGWFALFVPLTLFIALSRYIPSVADGMQYSHSFQWIPSYNINAALHLDGLSLLFGLLITGIGTLVILYSIFYLSKRESLAHFYVYLLLFMGAMLGLVFSDHILILYFFWELTSISSFLLIAFWYYRTKSRYGAQKSLLITVTGGIAMLTGFIMLYHMTGTFSIREMTALLPDYINHSLFIPALLLILLGAFTKSVQFPFHIWLPDAMEAPTPVSAYLHSATMVKAGIYLIARFTPIFGHEKLWMWSVSIVGLITLLWGAFCAVRQTDLKALLAYSTISQLGLITCLLGIGSAVYAFDFEPDALIFTQAMFVAFFHLFNHSTFKGTLFMVIGIIDHTFGSRDIRKLGGLISFMPATFTIAVIGSFSMAGLPPFNGFLSKEMFFTAMKHVYEWNMFSSEAISALFPVVAWIASIFTFVYCMIIIFQTFFGKYDPEKYDRPPLKLPFGIVIAPAVLSLFIVGIFFMPNVISTYLLNPIMTSLYEPLADAMDLTPRIHAWQGWTLEVWMTIGIVIFGIFLYKSFHYWKKVYNLFPPKRSFDALYNFILERGEKSARSLTKWYMTGSLRNYFSYIFVFFIIAVGGSLIYTQAFSFTLANDAAIRVYEWVIVAVMLVAGIMILFAKSRITAILLNGVLGYSIAALFVIFRAPDLALTQLVVESVTTALFLLCFRFLPEFKLEEPAKKSVQLTNALISVAVGTVFILVALSVNSTHMFESIVYFFENAYELTGSHNIVNAILGDFRAFDTMLEAIVLFLAGLGVFTLIKLKKGREEKNVEDQ